MVRKKKFEGEESYEPITIIRNIFPCIKATMNTSFLRS